MKPDLSIISSLYRAEAHYDRFGPAIIDALRALTDEGMAVEWIPVVNDATQADWEMIRGVESALSGIAEVRPAWVDRETIYASWNRGVRQARSEALAFWNADDLRSAGGLREAAQRIAAGADLVYFEFDIEYHDPSTERFWRARQIPPPYDPFLFSRLMWFGPFFVFRRDLYDRTGPFDEQFTIAGDLEWSARAVHVAGRVARADESGGVFASHGMGLSTKYLKRCAHEDGWIRRRHAQWDQLAVWERKHCPDFRVGQLADSEAPGGWRPIPPDLRAPLAPSESTIAWYYYRGRLRYRLFTRLLWLVSGRYNLRRLRNRMLRDG